MTARFKLKSNFQTIALYKYLKYLGIEFLEMKDLNGTIEIAALANLFG